MNKPESLVHSRSLPPEQGGELLHLPRQKARWEWMSFFVRRLLPGQVYQANTDGEEAAFVLLGGVCLADWGQGTQRIGKRKNVFDGFPFAVYLPSGKNVSFAPESACEIADAGSLQKPNLSPDWSLLRM
jgi:5-deoxy-D-glucuronate isomerase